MRLGLDRLLPVLSPDRHRQGAVLVFAKSPPAATPKEQLLEEVPSNAPAGANGIVPGRVQ